jgi:hypothetical protein
MPKQANPTPSSELSVAKNASSVLYRDAFGFAKVIVMITSTGKIYGIHSSTGSILWSRILGLDFGMIVPDPKLHIIRSVLDGAIAPIVAVIANRQDGSVRICSSGRRNRSRCFVHRELSCFIWMRLPGRCSLLEPCHPILPLVWPLTSSHCVMPIPRSCS